MPITTAFVVGDSISAPRDNAWPAHSLPVVIANRAIPGDLLVSEIEPAFEANLALETDKDTVFLQGGVNDIRAGEVLVNLQAAMMSMINQSNSASKNVYLCEVAPFKNAPLWNQAQQDVADEFNSWINELGYPVIPLYSLLSDPSDPDAMLLAYDLGDGLHPNFDGHSAIGDYVATLGIAVTPKPDFGSEVLDDDLSQGMLGGYAFSDGSGDKVTDLIGSFGDATVIVPPMGNTWEALPTPDMIALDFTGDTDKALRTAVNAITSSGAGYTMIAKVIPENVAVGGVICGFFNGASNEYDILFLSSAGYAGCQSRHGTNTQTAQGGTMVNGAPVILAGVYPSNNERSLYVQGALTETNTVSVAERTWTKCAIGSLDRPSPILGFQGKMIQVYLYGEALSAAKIAAISSNPNRVVSPSSGSGNFFVYYSKRRR